MRRCAAWVWVWVWVLVCVCCGHADERRSCAHGGEEEDAAATHIHVMCHHSPQDVTNMSLTCTPARRYGAARMWCNSASSQRCCVCVMLRPTHRFVPVFCSVCDDMPVLFLRSSAHQAKSGHASCSLVVIRSMHVRCCCCWCCCWCCCVLRRCSPEHGCCSSTTTTREISTAQQHVIDDQNICAADRMSADITVEKNNSTREKHPTDGELLSRDIHPCQLSLSHVTLLLVCPSICTGFSAYPCYHDCT